MWIPMRQGEEPFSLGSHFAARGTLRHDAFMINPIYPGRSWPTPR